MMAISPEQERASREWLAPSAAARLLGVSAPRVRQLMAEGKLEFNWTPLGRVVSVASVADLAEQRRQTAVRARA
jgi:hypothetical protein